MNKHPMWNGRQFTQQPAAILFDLDGTFADTAPDLAAPVNQMRVDRGMQPLPISDLRRFASAGARGLIGRALGITPEQAEYEPLRVAFLDSYAQNLCVHTTLFPGIDTVIDHLDSIKLPWGIVSNKVERLVKPIMAQLGLSERSALNFGGDTAARAKPHPDSLLMAVAQLGVPASQCVYVGDDLRDIQAGKSAGMLTIAALFGYCGADTPPEQWGADASIESAEQLLSLLP